LEIDKTRLEREILELQRRADRERTKREELESRLSENASGDAITKGISMIPLSPISPAAYILSR
jgi:hypothetical protein